MGTLTSCQFVFCLVSLCALLYVVYMLCRPREPYNYNEEPEYFEEGETVPPPPSGPKEPTVAAGVPAAASPPPVVAASPPPALESEYSPTAEEPTIVFEYDLQSAIDFSDLTVTDKQRKEYQELQENAKQILTVDERYNAAKRKTEEHKLKPGILPTKKRRELMEALIRRPYCGRRTRSWRTQFSDNIRGDVVPKNKDNSWSMMRVGRSDPTIDLHPGALGMNSSKGQWVSDENIPENMFDDLNEDLF